MQAPIIFPFPSQGKAGMGFIRESVAGGQLIFTLLR